MAANVAAKNVAFILTGFRKVFVVWICLYLTGIDVAELGVAWVVSLMMIQKRSEGQCYLYHCGDQS